MSSLNRPRLLHLLCCPNCYGNLREERESLVCARTHRFPIVKGVPVFTEMGRNVEVRRDDHLSNQPDLSLLGALTASHRPWLHLGAGATPRRFPGSVELESAIFRNTDIVGDASQLPIHAETMGGLLALNVFEHLAEPDKAAAEIHRVLCPGAPVLIQTAFLQPLHADPSHYYNCTEEGLRRWFKRFEIEAVEVPGNLNPVFAFAWMASELLFGSSGSASAFLKNVKLGELADIWANPDKRSGPIWDEFLELPDKLCKVLAAGFELRARRAAE